MSNSDYACPICSTIIIFLLSIITIPAYIYPYFYGANFEKSTCYISEINYPTTTPTFDNYSNWEKCNCGKKCTSYSPCIKLFTNSSLLIYDKYPRDSKIECTFHEEICKDGEDIRNIETYLEESQNIYDQYINTTIDCYIDTQKNNAYIDLDTSLSITIVCLTFIGLLVTCCIGFLINIKITEYRKNRQLTRSQSQSQSHSSKKFNNPSYIV